MILSLTKIFEDIDLSWIDSSKDLTISSKYNDLLSIFPNLKGIFQDGIINDKPEFHRTINHVFRVFKIFFLLKNGDKFHKTLSPDSIQKIKVKINNQFTRNELIVPLILMYHDIGRFFDKKNHPHQSFILISDKKLLDSFELLDNEKLLVSKVIQYHLLFATIYTGESTFFGIYSLLNDNEFIKLISNKEYLDIFVDLLEIFTYIDILGYSYASIYDHYTIYYEEINFKLKEILNFYPDSKKALEKAFDYSQNSINWRISGALRIFQFVDTKPYLTKNFYYDKLKKSVNDTGNAFIDKLDWKMIKKNYLVHSGKVQIKYGIGILMILAFGDFFRSRMKKETHVSYKLILFWIFLSREITSKSSGNNRYLWNVFFTGLPHWSKFDKKLIEKLDDKAIEVIIVNSSKEFDKEKKEFNLYLDFNQIFS